MLVFLLLFLPLFGRHYKIKYSRRPFTIDRHAIPGFGQLKNGFLLFLGIHFLFVKV